MFISCGNTGEDTTKNPESITEPNLEGYWGNTLYVDELLNKGVLEPQVMCPIIWTSVVFEIKHDTLIRIGFTHDFDTLAISNNIDSLATMESFGTYKLSYDIESDLLNTTTIGYKRAETTCGEITSFRKLTKEEGKKIQVLLAGAEKSSNLNE